LVWIFSIFCHTFFMVYDWLEPHWSTDVKKEMLFFCKKLFWRLFCSTYFSQKRTKTLQNWKKQQIGLSGWTHFGNPCGKPISSQAICFWESFIETKLLRIVSYIHSKFLSQIPWANFSQYGRKVNRWRFSAIFRHSTPSTESCVKIGETFVEPKLFVLTMCTTYKILSAIYWVFL